MAICTWDAFCIPAEHADDDAAHRRRPVREAGLPGGEAVSEGVPRCARGHRAPHGRRDLRMAGRKIKDLRVKFGEMKQEA